MRIDFGDLSRALLAGAQRIAGPGMIELAERDGLAGRGGAALLRLLTEQLEHAGHAIGDVGGPGQLRAFRDRACEHADDRHFAAMRGVQGLHHKGGRLVACGL